MEIEEVQKFTTDFLIQEISAKLKDYRWENRLNVEDFAKEAGVSGPMIRELERGVVGNISLNKLISIVKALGFNIVQLKLKKL